MMKPSITVIVPAYLEAANLNDAYASTIRALQKAAVTDYEILIITNNKRDGTNDGTPDIAANIARRDPRVRPMHNTAYVNLGFKFRQGVRDARKDYVTWVPGDNETVEDSIVEILRHTGSADMILSYTANKEVRTWKRRLVSRGFTFLCNALFGLRIAYYNGICIYPRTYLQAVPMVSDNFAYMAEIIVYLVKSGISYKEVPMHIKTTSASSAFKLRSVIEALGTLMRLFWNIHFRRIRVSAAPVSEYRNN